jgi:hypothetical protein
MKHHIKRDWNQYIKDSDNHELLEGPLDNILVE